MRPPRELINEPGVFGFLYRDHHALAGIGEPGRLILLVEVKLSCPRIAQLARELFPIIRSEGAFDAQNILRRREIMHAAKIGTAEPKPAENCDLLRRKLVEERLSLVR